MVQMVEQPSGRRTTAFGDEWWPKEAGRRGRRQGDAGSLRQEREERGGRKVARRFKLGPVAPTELARLSHITCSATTGGHAEHNGWVTNRATEDGAT
jgi:hypothetical protein